jgi:hypothetical protein
LSNWHFVKPRIGITNKLKGWAINFRGFGKNGKLTKWQKTGMENVAKPFCLIGILSNHVLVLPMT